MIADPQTLLKKHWGYENFRGSQESIIGEVMQGKDVLALLPTGGGKSVCYQIPALSMGGICIVVSPLVALIQDQVTALKRRGIKAIALSGGIPFKELLDLLDNCLYGNYKFLYLSPERLQQELILEKISQMKVSLVAIDEAHCISQWGHYFRPAYLQCRVLRELAPEAPFMALTATATDQVSKDIMEHLGLVDPVFFKDSFSRSNLTYSVWVEEDKNHRLTKLCSETKRSGIVYVSSRRASVEISRFLSSKGIPASYYHGGIPTSEKKKKLDLWLNGTHRVMVATNAFGMGIDNPNVELVVHYHIPESIENYFQEAGRAGRDGMAARAVLLTNKADEHRLMDQFLSSMPDTSFLKLLYVKLNNFFQIPYGTLEPIPFQFRFDEFCERYGLNSKLTYNGLRVLDQNSVISLSPNFSRKTTVKFTSGKKELWSYLENNPGLSDSVQALLRTYGGVFDFETPINLSLIAKKSSIGEEVLLRYLEQLHKDRILELKSKNRDLEITFLVPREDDRTINIFAKKVRKHQDIRKQQLLRMLEYTRNNRKCRNRQLLGYFGERIHVDCGKCDVCLRKNHPEASLIQKVEKNILAVLASDKCSSRQLIELLPFDESIILESIRNLLENEEISINNSNQYTLN
ncbi:MAG: RecQ family ATP-dependent DNA helicase [Bacteroidota bacterium]